MPELPEVETVRRTLAPAVGGTIGKVWTSGLGLHMRRIPPKAALKKLAGARIIEIRRHGKYLLLDTDTPKTILVHLGMTGRLRIHDPKEPRGKHTHVILGLGARELRYDDARRFGQFDVIERATERDYPALRELGPDALVDGVDPKHLLERAHAKTTTLKSYLLDQRVLAGVGNIYASEALWRARLKPTRRTNRLTAAEAKRLASAIREVLTHALQKGGTTISDFVNADGIEGKNADYLWVYDRAGLPCFRCKTPIRRSVHQGRATYFCPSCQM
ncbi:MAG TPA: bifunctional DNA-formamidopyrimidine glycosylase/DNA-(apurinic or apyrimidinic site) lyase [Kofleriaceae bacterium]|jgi:formamidopyrimidine-DNA glycosylase